MELACTGSLVILGIAILLFRFLFLRRLGFLGFIAGLIWIAGSWWLSLLWLGHQAVQCTNEPTSICEYGGGLYLFTIAAIAAAGLYLVCTALISLTHWYRQRHNPLPTSYEKRPD